MNKRFRFFIECSPRIDAALKPWYAFRRGLSAMRRDPHERCFANLTAFLAADPQITVAEFNGVFTVSARSDLFRRLVQYGQYEPQLVESCRALVDAGRDVIDVGANVGFYTVFFAKLIGGSQRVLAIEPTPNALRHLRMNLAANAIADKVEVFDGVALDVNGEIAMKYIENREEYSSVGVMDHPSIKGSILKTIPAQARTVDELVSRHALRPGFVKIDVEGMEHKVIAGMKAAMEVHRPVILCELSDPLLRKNGSNSAEVIALIRSRGYKVYDPLYPEHPAGTRAYGDIMCVPA